MFRDVRECLDAGNRLHTLLASQKPSRKSIPILIDVEQGIYNGSLGIFKNSIQQYIIFVYSFFLKKHYQKPDRVSNSGPLTYESGALPIALRGPAALC